MIDTSPLSILYTDPPPQGHPQRIQFLPVIRDALGFALVDAQQEQTP